MITFVCDICGYSHKTIFVPARMYEITLKMERKNKKKIHICENCLRQIAEKSFDMRSDTE